MVAFYTVLTIDKTSMLKEKESVLKNKKCCLFTRIYGLSLLNLSLNYLDVKMNRNKNELASDYAESELDSKAVVYSCT